ncbi:hypothetical protein PoB_006071800 [Plakobranchus ocellatus]|uniref:Response regulatory domain-containing protein n=1 Tax=Plakobranchus ocellatus TaxID=259542 RepID=A0AAV4CQP6_9GAST|nr:hypothetical protein PoB_006071800 [Plakobranchus ocellatus]
MPDYKYGINFKLQEEENILKTATKGLIDVGNEGHGGVDDEQQIHINTNDSDDGLLDDPQTNDDRMMKVVIVDSLTIARQTVMRMMKGCGRGAMLQTASLC